jgi:molybdopterin-guanine dinucleotide biosynthesis protein A
MGRDKAFVEVDGAPMVRRVADALVTAGAGQLLVVGVTTFSAGRRERLADALGGLDVELVEDDDPDEGPLGGILTALRHSRHDVTLVVSCDLLAPSPEAFAVTVARAADADVAVPVQTFSAGRRERGPSQWLHAAWHRRAANPLQGQFDAGERAIRRAVRAAALSVVEVEGLAPEAFADADIPGDLG